MMKKTTKDNLLNKKEEGFTLVEVIAVLVILGILAAVAIPKFFDMQETAREKAILGAVGELNAQVALSFAQNALEGGTTGGCTNFSGQLGGDFNVNGGTVTTDAKGCPNTDIVIELTQDTPGAHLFTVTWIPGSNDSPGYFSAVLP